VQEDPKAYQVFNNVGIIQMKLGDTDKAVKALQHSIELNPDYYPAYFNLARVYEMTGKIDLASRQYQIIRSKASKRPEDRKIVEAVDRRLAELKKDIEGANSPPLQRGVRR